MKEQNVCDISLFRLGTAVAETINDCAQPENSAICQVRGYLRWYGELTQYKGYWPLVEIISHMLTCAELVRDTLSHILIPYAEVWDCDVSDVQSAVYEVIEQAVKLHPAFASQILGGFSKPWDPLSFIPASVDWLTNHRLILNEDENEAFWQVWLSHLGHYITNVDRCIVEKYSAGSSFQEIALELGNTIEEVERSYQQTVERANNILYAVNQCPIKDYLSKVGFMPWMDGIEELSKAVELVIKDPSLLVNSTYRLYPALGEAFGLTPYQVSQKLRGILNEAYLYNKDIAHGKYNEFFKKARIQGERNSRIPDLLYALIEYIQKEEDRADKDRQSDQ